MPSRAREAQPCDLLVGGYALAVHAAPRFTKDLDVWVVDAETLERSGGPTGRRT